METKSILLDSILHDNSKINLILLMMVIFMGTMFLSRLIKTIYDLISKSEKIKIGPFEIKNPIGKKTESKIETLNSHNLDYVSDLDVFIEIVSMLMRLHLNYLKTVIDNKYIEIHGLEHSYYAKIHRMFKDRGVVMVGDYKNEFILLLQEKLNVSSNENIRNTGEYFFIDALINDFYEEFKLKSEEIISSNHFIELMQDNISSKTYIEALKNSINKCINIEKMNYTNLTKEEIDSIITKVNDKNEEKLSEMFRDCAKLKKQTDEKIISIKNEIDSLLTDSIKNIIIEAKNKIIDSREKSNNEFCKYMDDTIPNL